MAGTRDQRTQRMSLDRWERSIPLVVWDVCEIWMGCGVLVKRDLYLETGGSWLVVWGSGMDN